MNVFKKYMSIGLIINSGFCFAAESNEKKEFSLTKENVIAELHKTYDMYILLRSIADSFEESSSEKKWFGDNDSIIVQFNTINTLVITGNATVRVLLSEAESVQTTKDVMILADQSKPVGDAVEDIASVLSDPHMQEAAEAVSSFALTMSKTEHQKKKKSINYFLCY